MWEYMVKDLYREQNSPSEQIKILNHYGEDNWELVTVEGDMAYFKRIKVKELSIPKYTYQPETFARVG